MSISASVRNAAADKEHRVPDSVKILRKLSNTDEIRDSINIEPTPADRRSLVGEGRVEKFKS